MIYYYPLILAIIGIVLAYYVWSKKSRKEKLVCIIGKDCSKVVESKYGKTLGIDNTLLGMIYYVFVIIASLVAILDSAALTFNLFTTGFLVISGAAALFSLYLAFVQLFILKELCEYCLGSTLIAILIFISLII